MLTRNGLTNEYFIDIENTLIADSYTAVDKPNYTKGLINNLAITGPGSKFISKGGYVVEYKKDNAFKTDFLFKILTAFFAVVAIGLSVYTKIIEDKNIIDKRKLNEKNELLEKNIIELQKQLNELHQKH